MPFATALAIDTDENEIDYPDTDGEPMAESDFQRDSLTYLVEALKSYFKYKDNVYVSGNVLIYYEKGDPRASVSPDVFVVFGIPKYQRKSYKTWVEGKVPDVVIEITSHSTRKKDQIDKPKLYSQLGIREYFQYDPTGDYLRPALHGQVLDKNGHYQELNLEKMENGVLSLTSFRLGLQLHLENGTLQVFDPRHKEYRLPYSEEVEARQVAEKKVKQERQQREIAQQQAKQEREEKELAQAKAEKLAELLRAHGINPDDID